MRERVRERETDRRRRSKNTIRVLNSTRRRNFTVIFSLILRYLVIILYENIVRQLRECVRILLAMRYIIILVSVTCYQMCRQNL